MLRRSYLDREGYQRRDWPGDVGDIRRMEKWIKKLMDERNATIPEVICDMVGLLTVAVDNVRGEIFRQRRLKKRRKED